GGRRTRRLSCSRWQERKRADDRGVYKGGSMPVLKLTPDELLSTTRAVRRRLDLTRAVPRELVEECVALAVQAPTSTNMQTWHFIVVTESDRRADLAELYRRSWSSYADGRPPDETPASETTGQASSRYLAAHLHEVPVHVIPCIEGRPEGMA